MEHEGDGHTNFIVHSQRFTKVIRGLEELEIGGRAESIQTTALLRSARTLRRVLEICCHSDSNERPSANAYLLAQMTRPYNNQSKKTSCGIVDFSVLADH